MMHEVVVYGARKSKDRLPGTGTSEADRWRSEVQDRDVMARFTLREDEQFRAPAWVQRGLDSQGWIRTRQPLESEAPNPREVEEPKPPKPARKRAPRKTAAKKATPRKRQPRKTATPKTSEEGGD